MQTRSLTAPTLPLRLSGTLTGLVSAIARGIAVASGAQARFDRVRRLQGLSDAELARLGLRRDDIVRHVYSEVFAD